MQEELIKIIEKFKEHRIAVIGDIILDSYVYGKINRLNPESAAPLITIDDSEEEFRLGGASNTALNAKSLGAEVELYGLLGDDENAVQIEELCRKNKISLVTGREGKTIKKQRFIEKNSDKNSFHYMMRADFGEEFLNPISLENEDLLIREFKKRAVGYRGIVLSDYNKRVLRGSLGKRVIEISNENGIISLVDPKPANNVSNFKKVSVVRPNLSEAKKIVGKSDISLDELAKELKELMQAKYSVISCGADGIATYDGNFNHLPAKAGKIVDVSGAGDTVASALILSLLSGASIVQAAKIANYAAGIAVEKQGTSSVSAEELINKIRNE